MDSSFSSSTKGSKNIQNSSHTNNLKNHIEIISDPWSVDYLESLLEQDNSANDRWTNEKSVFDIASTVSRAMYIWTKNVFTERTDCQANFICNLIPDSRWVCFRPDVRISSSKCILTEVNFSQKTKSIHTKCMKISNFTCKAVDGLK